MKESSLAFALGQSGWRSTVMHECVSVLVGVYPHERELAQCLKVCVRVSSHLSCWPKVQDDLINVIDYDPIRRHIQQWSKREHTQLLETLLLDLVQFCFLYDARIDHVEAGLTKCDAEETFGSELSISRQVWQQRGKA